MRKRSHLRSHKELAAETQHARPGDFPLGSLQSRAAARAALPPQVVYTVIINVPDEPLHLESSSCERLRWPNGEICELVYLDGRASDISQEELYRFIERYPIRPG